MPESKKKWWLKKTREKKKPGKKDARPLRRRIFFALLLAGALSPFYYGYLIKPFTSAWRWLNDIGTNPHYRTYKSFHIRIPDQYAVHGIDVSSYQGVIDWTKVKAMHEGRVHLSFAFIKATEGVFKVDPYFERNWRDAPKAGIICGAYHYFKPKFDGVWQARFFLQNVKTEKGDLPVVVDVEELDGVQPDVMRKELNDFLKTTAVKTGARPIIYTGLKFYKDNLQGYFNTYAMWFSNYDNPEPAVDSGTKWTFWQHSDRARVNGIKSPVDFDAFNGDSLAFRKMLIR